MRGSLNGDDPEKLLMAGSSMSKGSSMAHCGSQTFLALHFVDMVRQWDLTIFSNLSIGRCSCLDEKNTEAGLKRVPMAVFWSIRYPTSCRSSLRNCGDITKCGVNSFVVLSHYYFIDFEPLRRRCSQCYRCKKGVPAGLFS